MSDELRSILIRRSKPDMIKFLRSKPQYFQETLRLAINNEPDLSWRSAWVIEEVMDSNDIRVQPFINKILKVIPIRNDGHQRELLKIILNMNLKEDFESSLFDLCVDLWEQVRKKPSVRHFAFLGMIKVEKKYPELKNEVLLLTEPHFIEPLSPGIKKSVLKSVAELKSPTEP